jgi:uncharacterized protein YkwD
MRIYAANHPIVPGNHGFQPNGIHNQWLTSTFSPQLGLPDISRLFKLYCSSSMRSPRVLLVLLALIGLLPQISGAQISMHRPAPPPAVSMTQTVRPVPPAAAYRSNQKNDRRLIQPQSAPLAVYSHGNPTDEEQYILELINRARSRPDSEGIRLQTTTDPDISNAYNQWGVSRTKVRNDFQNMPVRPPLAFHPILIQIARAHDQDMLDNNFQAHNGTDGRSPFQRMNDAGYTGWSGAGENIFAYGKSMWDIHASFNIDFGNESTYGHRHNIMNDEGTIFTEVGIGVIHGGGGGGVSVGPIITTEDFGARSTYITGVVYNDKNKNHFYDMGEGIAGVTIKPSVGTTTAVTSSSGGYAIPFTTDGTVSITASGGTFGTSVSHTIEFNGENVKVDFNPNATGLPDQVTIIGPTVTDTVKLDNAKLVWNKIAGATKYRVQVSPDTGFSAPAKLLVNDSTLSDTIKTITGLQDGQQYYWRVQARNAKGWGEYSAVAVFGVAMPPTAIVLVSPGNNGKMAPSFPRFKWQHGSSTIFTYHFQLALDTEMTNFISNDTTLSDTTTTVQSLVNGTKYFWRVRGMNEVGWGPFSPIWSVLATTASVESNSTTGNRLSIAQPNPTSGKVLIKFSLKESEDVVLTIVNEAGDQVSLLASERLQPNSYSFEWDGSSFAASTYFYHLRIGNSTETGRIVRY